MRISKLVKEVVRYYEQDNAEIIGILARPMIEASTIATYLMLNGWPRSTITGSAPTRIASVSYAIWKVVRRCTIRKQESACLPPCVKRWILRD